MGGELDGRGVLHGGKLECRPISQRTQALAALLARYAILALLLALAAFLRLSGLGDDSLWRDEAASWLQSQGSLVEIIVETARDNSPPLHNLVLAGAMRLLEDSEVALRLPSAIFGILNVLAIYWLGAIVAGRFAATAAAFLLALSGFHVWFSQEARAYALFTLAATLFAGCSIEFFKRATRGGAVLVALSGAVLLYSHPFGLPTWLSIALPVGGLLARRHEPKGPSLRQWMALQAAILVLFVPWALVLIQRTAEIQANGFWIPFPTPFFAAVQIGLLLTPRTMFWIFTIACLAALAGEVGRTRSGLFVKLSSGSASKIEPRRDLTYIIIAWAVGPIAFALAVSVVTTPIFYSRYFIGSLPALLLLAGIGIERFGRDRLAIGICAVAAVVFAWPALIRNGPTPREDWRSAARVIALAQSEPYCVVLPNQWGIVLLRYYDVQNDCMMVASTLASIERRAAQTNLVFVVDLAETTGTGGRRAKAKDADRFPASAWSIEGVENFEKIEVTRLRRK